MYQKCKVKAWGDRVCEIVSRDGEYVIIQTLLPGNTHPSKFEFHINKIVTC